MPIYEYTCQDCHSQFEEFVRSMTAAIEVKCPECGSAHTKKGWSLFGLGAAAAGLGGFAAGSSDSCSTSGTST